ITYERLLDVFWHNVDPVTANQQFCDRGTQYRAAIFYHDERERQLAEASKAALEAEKRFSKPIVTQIVPATTFYPAEDYHQHYYRKNPVRYGMYRVACGRDRRLREIWGIAAPSREVQSGMHDTKPSDAELRRSLTQLQYQVTQ